MKIASYNIHKTKGIDGSYDSFRPIMVLQEIMPDIVAIQEIDKRFGRRTGLICPGMINSLLGLKHVNYTQDKNGLGWHGNSIFIKHSFDVLFTEVKHLPGFEPRGAILTEISTPNGTIRIINCHLGLLPRCRFLQANFLIDWINSRENMKTIICGDLNEWVPINPAYLS